MAWDLVFGVFSGRGWFRVWGFGWDSLNTYLWLVGNGRKVVIVVIIVPHSSIPY